MTNEELDAKIEEWHNLPFDSPGANMSLCDYLGMTWEEYKQRLKEI